MSAIIILFTMIVAMATFFAGQPFIGNYVLGLFLFVWLWLVTITFVWAGNNPAVVVRNVRWGLLSPTYMGASLLIGVYPFGLWPGLIATMISVITYTIYAWRHGGVSFANTPRRIKIVESK